MRRAFCFAVLAFVSLQAAVAQGGAAGGSFGGGGFGGGGQLGGAGGQRGDLSESAMASEINAEISTYLSGNPVHSILTPGEFTEWKLDLKAGQVVIAEAKSESFDPALEVLGADNKSLAFNDDRYPGDQRPLLLWRCPADGQYLLHARCFRDKAGGPVDVLYKVFESIDLPAGEMRPVKVKVQKEFLSRVTLKRGQIVQFLTHADPNRSPVAFGPVISPSGLPDVRLLEHLGDLRDDSLMAAQDGDYYVLCSTYSFEAPEVNAGFNLVSPQIVPWDGKSATGKGTRDLFGIWSIDVKAGEFIEASSFDLAYGSSFTVAEEPSTHAPDPLKPDDNPFYPQARIEAAKRQPAFIEFPARARDGRTTVVLARRDARIWLVLDHPGSKSDTFQFALKPAAQEFGEGREHSGRLGLGRTDYWSFDAKVGDVMTWRTDLVGFIGHVTLYDPTGMAINNWTALPDDTSLNSTLIVEKPGRYAWGLGSYGDGGSGTYRLTRSVYHPKEFAIGSPATGELTEGQVSVWKFSVKASQPVLLHWKTDNRPASVSYRDPEGHEVKLAMTSVSATDTYGILQAVQQKDYVIVVVGPKAKCKYLIELLNLPGLGKGG